MSYVIWASLSQKKKSDFNFIFLFNVTGSATVSPLLRNVKLASGKWLSFRKLNFQEVSDHILMLSIFLVISH